MYPELNLSMVLAFNFFLNSFHHNHNWGAPPRSPFQSWCTYPSSYKCWMLHIYISTFLLKVALKWPSHLGRTLRLSRWMVLPPNDWLKVGLVDQLNCFKGMWTCTMQFMLQSPSPSSVFISYPTLPSLFQVISFPLDYFLKKSCQTASRKSA